MTIGASRLVADIEVAGQLVRNDGEDRRWKQAVMEAMEERFKRRESEAGFHNRARRREEDFCDGWNGRRGDSRDRKMERKESRICHACGERGHIRKDSGRTKKDGKFQGRDL